MYTVYVIICIGLVPGSWENLRWFPPVPCGVPGALATFSHAIQHLQKSDSKTQLESIVIFGVWTAQVRGDCMCT